MAACVAAFLLAAPVQAGSGAQSCGRVPNIEAQIQCWSHFYQGAKVYRFSDAELVRLVETTISDMREGGVPDSYAEALSTTTQAVWLHHAPHGDIVWIIAADERGNIVQQGKATMEFLRSIIRGGS